MVLSENEINKRIKDSYEIPNKVLKSTPNPMVTVRTSTYQHGKYIKKCIEGVLMQKTTFPIEFIIGEDYSTDGTREIVLKYAKEYPDIIRVFTADYNVGSKANGMRCINASRGKYMAICEGDDYWTDPLKLQKQVDFLEGNEEYGLVHTNYACVDGDNNSIDKFNRSWPSGDVFNLIMRGKYGIVTASTLYRMDLFKEVKQELSMMRFKMGDLPLWLSLARISKVKYLDDNTTNYRILENSASHSTELSKVYDFHYDSFLVKKHFADKYNITFNEKESILRLNRVMVKQAYLKNDYGAAKVYFHKSINGNLLTVFNPKTTLFYLGTRFVFFDKLIKLLYKI